MRDGSSDLVPEGTVGTFDRPEQLAELPEEDRDKMRAVVLDHDNDPAQISLRLAVKQPAWLEPGPRGRNIPESMKWIPLLTFVQVGVDAMNAMRVIPGEFKPFGHDYRGDTAEFVHAAFHFDPVAEDQMEKVDAPKRTAGPRYLRDRISGGPQVPEMQATAGEAEADYQ